MITYYRYSKSKGWEVVRDRLRPSELLKFLGKNKSRRFVFCNKQVDVFGDGEIVDWWEATKYEDGTVKHQAMKEPPEDLQMQLLIGAI